MTAETVVAEPHTATRADVQESEDRLHRELQHYATKADLKETELRVQANIRDTELRLLAKIQEVQVELQAQIKDAQMWLLLRLGGLIVAVVTVAVAVLKLLS